ncbi:hypothetical protein GE061_019360 [Apolygus lucorum]|uniref:Daxx histone-binding domain-containing protein n=1 Tax=Apolygus lucorum TaxID=248454 RepID=A0A6A4JV67_APOLU|nr:hypothetical protein GE061_019360 [Apolygus lucorum]
MVMPSVITLSSDEDDGDIQIIEHKRVVPLPVKAETSDSAVAKCNKLIKRITPALLTNSVTILKVESTSSESVKHEAVHDARQSGPEEDSDDDIICLESESVIKNAAVNGVRSPTSRKSVIEFPPQHLVPKKEPVLMLSDEDGPCAKKHDQNGNVHISNSSSSKSDVILIDSDDESSDVNSSEDPKKQEEIDEVSSEDEVQLLTADDLSNVCHAEESSEGGTSDSREGERNEANQSESAKPRQDSNGPSTSRMSPDVQPCSSSSSTQPVDDELSPSGPGNLTEKLLKQLNVKIKQYGGFSEENQKVVTKKIMRYYSSASEEFTQSQKFIDQIKNLISEMSRLMALPNSKDMVVIKQITDKIKEFLGEFQRGSTHLTPKLNKLYRMLDKLNRRIAKLETQEVDSDSEFENPYVMLDRYRKRAVQVYNKIRQLEGKSNHADRLYLQEFIYAGVGPVPVQRALEKYYNKTKTFPDFAEVYKLVKKVNTEKNLGLTSSQVHLTAQTVFEDFGNKLKRRREYDDFSILRSYLPECQHVDPAENDDELRIKLDVNKTAGKTEADVLKDFVNKQIAEGASSLKETATKDEESGEDTSKSDAEDSESEKDIPNKAFMDSDEEMEYFEKVQDRRRCESEGGPPTKKPRIDDELSVSSSSTNLAEEKPEAEPNTKISFLNKCHLEPS